MKIEEYNLCRAQWENLIDQWIFNETDRKILKRRLLDGIVFEDLAEEFGYSVVHIKNRVYRAQEQLFKRI